MKLSTALSLLALAAPLAAQGGGFTAGDLYVAGNILGSPPHGLVRVDPLSGDTLVLKKYTGITGGYESLVYDSYRQRLVLLARLDTNDGPLYRPYLIDAAGNFAPLDPPVALMTNFAPTGDGRIYFRDALTSAQPFKWYDAANQIHVLYDTDGVTPFVMGGFSIWTDDMIYVASQNALITVTSTPGTQCPGGTGPVLHLRKIPLSADGTRVAGAMSCGEFDMDPLDSEESHGLSLMPDGDLLLGGHSGHYGVPALPRLMRVDPATLATSAFAWFGDASNGGSTWSSALGKAVTQTHATGGLKAYSAGQVNGGADVSSGGVLVDTRYGIDEVPFLACDGGWIAYGNGLAGAGSVVPRIYGKGCPEPGASFELKLDQVVGAAGGTIFVGLAPAVVPFKGGTVFVGAIALNVSLAVGGTPGVAGAGSLTLPAALPSDPVLHGVSLFLQAAFHDSAAVKGVSLTQGLEIEIG